MRHRAATTRRLGLMLVLWAAAQGAVAVPATVPFASRAGYSLRYPASWHPHGWGGDRNPAQFLILSPGPGAEGVIIARNQALILARMQAAGEAIPAGARPVATPPGATPACRQWRRQDAQDNVGPEERVDPAALQEVVSLFCRTDGDRVMRLQLTFWARDRHGAAYLRTLRAVAGSLRLDRTASPAHD